VIDLVHVGKQFRCGDPHRRIESALLRSSDVMLTPALNRRGKTIGKASLVAPHEKQAVLIGSPVAIGVFREPTCRSRNWDQVFGGAIPSLSKSSLLQIRTNAILMREGRSSCPCTESTQESEEHTTAVPVRSRETC